MHGCYSVGDRRKQDAAGAQQGHIYGAWQHIWPELMDESVSSKAMVIDIDITIAIAIASAIATSMAVAMAMTTDIPFT